MPVEQATAPVHADSERSAARAPSAIPGWIAVTALFLVLGVMTTLKDVLVAHLKSIFALDYARAMEIPFFFFSSCVLVSVPFGRLMDRIGYRWSMVSGLVITALGAAVLFPAAAIPSFPLFLASLVIQGIGMMCLQVCANPFVTDAGPARTASSRLNLIQGFNAFGMALGPKIGGLFILSAAPLTAVVLQTLAPNALHNYQLQTAATVKPTYTVAIIILLGLALFTAFVPFPAGTRSIGHAKDRRSLRDLWNQTHLVLGAIGIFVYVGAEVAVGSFLVNYINQPYIGNVSLKTAAGYVAFYWGGAMAGRFVGSAVQQRIAPRAVLAVNAIAAAVLVCVSMLAFGHLAMWSMIAVGLCNSIMFPTIFTLAIADLGPLTGYASGVLAAACAGGAVIPELQGLIADRIGIHHSFLLPVTCYLYILYFAAKGSRQLRSGPTLPARSS